MNDSEKNGTGSDFLFNAVSECSLDGIFCKDIDLRYIFVNKTMKKQSGKSESEMLGKKYWELFDDVTAAKIEKINESVLKGNTEDLLIPLERGGRCAHYHYNWILRTGRKRNSL